MQASTGAFLDKQLPEEVFASCKIMSYDFQHVPCQNLLISSSFHTHFSWICTDQASDVLRQALECTQFQDITACTFTSEQDIENTKAVFYWNFIFKMN